MKDYIYSLVQDFLLVEWNFFQNSATPTMEGIINLHNYIFMFLCLVLVLVLTMLYNIYRVFYRGLNFPRNLRMLNFRYLVLLNLKVNHAKILEMIWTIFPAVILIFIALPSFFLLYAMDEDLRFGVNNITLKVVGYQWYWSYHYTGWDFPSWIIHSWELGHTVRMLNFGFDSNILPESELKFGQHRLLEVDRIALIPTRDHGVRLIVTSSDVLHSWAVPALGIKMDAVPGRLNQAIFYLRRPGVWYGQCSELCGPSHGFMPICVMTCPTMLFNQLIFWRLWALYKAGKLTYYSSIEFSYLTNLSILGWTMLFFSLLALFRTHKTLLHFIIVLEVLFLTVNVNFVILALCLNDMLGLLFSFFLLVTTGAEAAVALVLLVLSYKYIGTFINSEIQLLRG